MFFVEFCRPDNLRAAGDGDARWERYLPGFPTLERADNEAMWLSLDDSQYVYRVVEEPMSEPIRLDAVCDRCGMHLELDEGSREQLIGCPSCDAEPGEGATAADALNDWLDKQPAPVFLPSAISQFIVPRHPWVIEVDGFPFDNLADAEKFAAMSGGSTIYCRLARQKAANE